jgi:hypothetical protein
VDVDATDFGERTRTAAPHEAERTDELRGQTPRGETEQLNVGSGRAVTWRVHGLVRRERIYGIGDAIETPSMPLEHSEKTRMSPSRDLHNLLCAGLTELAKLQLTLFVPHVHAIKGQRMKMHVEPERAVRSLHKGERAYLRFADRA